MFVVTEKAKEKLLHILQSKTDGPAACIRISLSPEGKKITLSIDSQQNSDHIITDKNGKNVLLINTDILPTLEGHVFDFQEEHDGGGFTVSPIAQGDKKSE